MLYLVVLLSCWLTASSTARYSVNVERPCPMETVTFTCTVTGDRMNWETSDVTRITIRNSSNLNVPMMPRPGYTLTLKAFTNSTMTSTLSRVAEDGIIVSCVDPLPTLTTIGTTTISLVDPPGPPSIMPHSTHNSSVDAVSVTVQWDPPTDNGGRDDLTYTVIVSPPTQLSATVLTSTSITVTSQYNVSYTVNIVATNCAGNSTTGQYNFTIGRCPVLTNPTNGAFILLTSRLPGSAATLQCDAGYKPSLTMLMCLVSLMWSVEPEAIECTPLTAPPPTSAPPMNCTAPLSPPQNGSISDHSVPAVPDTQVTFQCFYGLFPEEILTVTCLTTGQWDRNPAEIVCRNESNYSVTVTPLSISAAVAITGIITFIAALVIGFLAGLLVMHLCSRKKAVYSPAAEGQANVGPTAPAGPVYEEVSLKEEIELSTNKAYGPVGL